MPGICHDLLRVRCPLLLSVGRCRLRLQARDRIIGLKGQILRNDETLGKLLAMATSGR